MQQLLKFGQRAEQWVIQVLRASGYTVIKKDDPAGETEDKVFKIDFWVQRSDRYVPIQFSINLMALEGEKGLDALYRRKVVPVWLDGEELEEAAHGNLGLQKKLVKHFWEQVETTIALFPDILCRRPAVEAMANHLTKGRGL